MQWRHAPPRAWKYCPLCRGDLTNHAWDGKTRRYCPQCGFVYWERPLPAVAAIIRESSHQGRVALVRRRYPPEEGQWTLPGGGIEAGESIEQAMIREAQEETALTIALDGEIGTWSTPSFETIITFFVAHRVNGELQAGSDALEAMWFDLDRLPSLAFSTHQDAVRQYLER
ncbi:NUDIX hydrolase [Sulfobacillus sp. DSM 109850]|uniref:NUDIX hydrolase n=1 Tax=Sulfobacillus harzensis TaxID=2729629 RepID=A0A7Y0Q394_9FIRM|nr:NUDIX hydrolase [Sulfobacillus harzensis]